MLGSSSKSDTTGPLQTDCEEPHRGIDALLPAEAQSNVSSLIPRLHLRCLSVVSLVFSFGVWKRLGHICRAYVAQVGETRKRSSAVPSRDSTNLILLLGLWVTVLHLKHLHYFIISNRFCFFLPVERLLLLLAYWKWSVFYISISVGSECSAHDDGFSAMSFYKKQLFSTSQWKPFSENVLCIIVIFFYLHFCQYLVWKVAYLPIISSFLSPFVFFSFRSVKSLFSCRW